MIEINIVLNQPNENVFSPNKVRKIELNIKLLCVRLCVISDGGLLYSFMSVLTCFGVVPSKKDLLKSDDQHPFLVCLCCGFIKYHH